jgi:hypothetical protein
MTHVNHREHFAIIINSNDERRTSFIDKNNVIIQRIENKEENENVRVSCSVRSQNERQRALFDEQQQQQAI